MEIRESLERILESDQLFGRLFYEVFFDRVPEAKAHFEHVDMERQATVLTMALPLVEQYYAHSYAAIAHYLQLLGTRHQDRSIPREMYPRWAEAMLVALERFHGDDWTEELAAQWREALDEATVTMLKGYDRRVGV